MGSVAGEGREGGILFFHPSGGIEPALNGFSRELVGKGKTGQRERQRDREAERDKERQLERKKGRVLGLSLSLSLFPFK